MDAAWTNVLIALNALEMANCTVKTVNMLRRALNVRGQDLWRVQGGSLATRITPMKAKEMGDTI